MRERDASGLADAHPWLLLQTLVQARGRLKLLKAAWILGGHPSPQPWFDQKGAKAVLLARIRDGLKAIDAETATVPAGLREAVLGEAFDFETCMQTFAFDWNAAMIKMGCKQQRSNTARAEQDAPEDDLNGGSRGSAVGELGAGDAAAEEAGPAEDGDLGAEGSAVLALLFGPRPRVRLSEERRACPKSLLPRDAHLLKPRAVGEPFRPCISDTVLAEAAAAGHRCAPAPAFLGRIPEALGLGAAPAGGSAALAWRTVLVIGPSGSGKTSLLRTLSQLLRPCDGVNGFYPEAAWSPGVAVIEGFSDFQTAQNWLCGVGLSSVPSWCKPHAILPLGEQYRANVARALAAADPDVPLMFDEWTSELDRGIARSVCAALKRRLAARRAAGQRDPVLVFATCHDDTELFLRPDVLIRCRAGEAPVVEYGGTLAGPRTDESGAQATLATPALRATFRGVAQPVSAEGTAVGFWRVGLAGGGTQAFCIRVMRGRQKADETYEYVVFAIAGAARGGTAAMRRESRQPGGGLVVAKHADAREPGIWLYARVPKFGLDLRVRWSGPEQLAVQFRQEHEGLSDLEAEVQARTSLRRTHLMAVAGEGQYAREKTDTYARRFRPRQAAISKLCELTDAESSALKVRAADRSATQQGTAKRLLQRLEHTLRDREAALESLRASPPEWEPELCATRVPRLHGSPFPGSHEVAGDEADDAVDRSGSHGPRLLQAGWYVPPDGDLLHPGLKPLSVVRCGPAFQLNPRKEACAPGLVHLASYVGEGAESSILSPALGEAALLLDEGFRGLCVHRVPSMDGPDQPNSTLEDFSLGVIMGSSGSGKSSLGRERFCEPVAVAWDEDSPALAHFRSLAEAEEALSLVALDLETAMRPVKLLSGGERERSTLAWALAEWAAGRQSKVVLDEFTSLLDRPLAHEVAANISAYARERPHLKGLVLVSSHQDLIGRGLLEPDWLFDCDRSRLLVFDRRMPEDLPARERKRRRTDAPPPSPAPELLVVRRALADEWAHFREHHYKDHRLMGQAVCFVGALQGRAVAFTAVIFTGFTLAWWLKSTVGQLGYPAHWLPWQVLREHRTVVLPDSQGLGLGSLMADAVAHLCAELGYVLMSKTAHPTYGGYRERSPFWVALPSNLRGDKDGRCVMFSHAWRGAVRADGSKDPGRQAALDRRVCLGEGRLTALL